MSLVARSALFAAALVAGCASHARPPGADGGTPAAHAISDDGHGTYTITLDRFVVAPGEERYACQDFANPFGATAAAIRRFASHQTPGAHHLLVFYAPGALDAPLASCSSSEFAPGPYGSERADDAVAYPDGVAAVVAPGDGFRVQVHYLNATPAPIEVAVTVTLERVAGGVVRDRAGILFFSNRAIDVAPGAVGAVVAKTCTLPFAVELLQATGHMHQHGRAFSATANGVTLFATATSTDVAPAAFAPPLALAAGTPITFACTYDNDGATPLGYGDSARSDEMCIFTAQFYPAPFGGWTCS